MGKVWEEEEGQETTCEDNTAETAANHRAGKWKALSKNEIKTVSPINSDPFKKKISFKEPKVITLFQGYLGSHSKVSVRLTPELPSE